jgi:hypothetical protein
MNRYISLLLFIGTTFWNCEPEKEEYKIFIEPFGNGGPEDFNCVKQTKDDGYVVVGWMISPGKYSDMWFIKTDSDGNEEWNKNFGGSEPYIERANHVHQTSDGGYSILGFKSLPQGYLTSQDEVWLIKTDKNGKGEWNYLYGTAIEDGDDQIGVCHQLTSDGGYIIVGDTKFRQISDILLLKVDCRGNQEWSKSFGGVSNDYGVFVQETYDGGYILVGNTLSFGSGGQDIILIKTDWEGNEDWKKTFGGESYEYSKFLLLSPDGGYVFGGSTNSFGNGDYDAWIIKTDNMGNIEWEKTYGDEEMDGACSCQHARDGGYIVAGTKSKNDTARVFLLQIGEYGSIKWEKTNIIEEKVYCRSIQQTSDKGFIIAGSSRAFGGPSIDTSPSGGVLIKTDPDGNTASY